MPPSPRSSLGGHLALAGAQVAFGLFPVLGTLAFGEGGFSPLGVGTWRIAFGALALGALALALHGPKALPARADLPRLALCAVLGVALNQGLFLVGLSRSTPLSAGLVMCLIPVFTYGLAVAARQEAPSLRRGAGIGLALAGVGPLVFSGGLGVLGAHGLGNLLMVANGLSYSGYLVLSKPLTRRHPSLVIIAWAYAGSIVALPWFAAGGGLVASRPSAWWALAYVLLFPTTLGYLLNMVGLARVPASTAAVYVYLQPFVAGLASWLAFGERPSPAMLAAAAALFAGIRLVARTPSLAPREAAPSGQAG